MQRSPQLLRWINLILVGVTFLAYLSPSVNPQTLWFPAFFGLAFPWFLLLHLLFITFWIWKQHWYVAFSIGCLLLGWGHIATIIGFNTRLMTTDEANTLSVMSFNAHSFAYFGQKTAFVSKQELQVLFEKITPQILCFQEFFYRKGVTDDYVKFLVREKGLTNHSWQPQRELAVFTSFPILAVKNRQFNATNGYQMVDLNVHGQRVRIFNVHLQSNSVSSAAERLAASGDIQQKETWLEVRTMMGRFKRAAQRRAVQAEEIVAEIAQSPYPVIVCGDFNDTPLSYTYRVLSTGLSDTFRQRGRGLGFTYVGRIPALRIDYILTPSQWTTLDFIRQRTSFSDHRPVATQLQMSVAQ